MKYLSLVLALGAILLLAVLIAGAQTLTPKAEPDLLPKVVVPIDPSVTRLENQLLEETTAYQSQLADLERALQQQQTDDLAKIEKLNSQIVASKAQLDTLETRKQTLLEQTQQLEAAQTEQQAAHQSQLVQFRSQHSARQAELQNQLNETRTRLAEINAQ